MQRGYFLHVCLITAVTVVSLCFSQEEASAVPSFARQTGKPCSGCHTIWPRLNATGREFKVQGYTEVAEDYPRIDKDNLDLLRYGPPLALSLISFPYSKTSGNKAETRIPEEAAIFFAGRMTPDIGAFVEPKWDRDSRQFSLELVKVSSATKVGNNTVGLVVLKSDIAGADPYNTLRFTSFHTVNTPAMFGQTRAAGDFFSLSDTENMGLLLNGMFINSVYAAVGGFRGDGSAANVLNDPVDLFGRLVFEHPLSAETIISMGGFYYDGKERYDHSYSQLISPGAGVVSAVLVALPTYETRIRRQGLDFQFQREATPHIFDVVAVYMAGRDEHVDVYGTSIDIASLTPPAAGPGSEIKFAAYYAELSYFYDRMYGVTVGYDHFKSMQDATLNKKGPTFNIAYLPWLNTKLALEYSVFDLADGTKERDTNFLVHLYF
jgi:hypothetical protein